MRRLLFSKRLVIDTGRVGPVPVKLRLRGSQKLCHLDQNRFANAGDAKTALAGQKRVADVGM